MQDWKVKWVKDIIKNDEVIRKNDKKLEKTVSKSKSGFWGGGGAKSSKGKSPFGKSPFGRKKK